MEEQADTTGYLADSKLGQRLLVILFVLIAASFVAFFGRPFQNMHPSDDVVVRAWEHGPEGPRELLPLPGIVNDRRYYFQLPTQERLQHVQITVKGICLDIVVTRMLPSQLPKTHGSYRSSDYVIPEEAIFLDDLTHQLPVN